MGDKQWDIKERAMENAGSIQNTHRIGASAEGRASAEVKAFSHQRSKSSATRAALLAVARECFSKDGYHATNTNDVAKEAAVSRGALYYHFADKESLFDAVLRQIADEVDQSTAACATAMAGDTWSKMLESLRRYLTLVATQKDIQRVLLVEGPAVLGWQHWRNIVSEHFVGGMTLTLQMLMDHRVIEERPPGPLASLIIAALNDASLSVAHAADPGKALSTATDALITLVAGLRRPESANP